MSISRNDSYKLGFTPWSQPMMAVTDDYEELVVGFKIGQEGFSYDGVSGRHVPAEGTDLFTLGAQ